MRHNLYLHNTKIGNKELFTPMKSGEVKMYVCGPTLYNTPHIGNLRPVVVFDVLHRLLRAIDYKVSFVTNITDIDDKIIAKANQCYGGDTKQVVAKYYDEYTHLLKVLNVLPASHTPKATDYIPSIVKFIADLINSDYAYVSSGHVFFAVHKFQEYGLLSGKKLNDLIANDNQITDELKLNKLDFVLWKPSKVGEPSWSSPWSEGRPGWHIECSAMIRETLGDKIDIHGGGVDLVFPHHENERAQTMCLTNCDEMANYWVHNAFVNIGDQKISKSVGNIAEFSQIAGTLESDYKGAILRLLLLSTHYRSDMQYSEYLLEQSSNNHQKILNLLEDVDQYGYFDLGKEYYQPCPKFMEAMLDDLNTPGGLTVIYELVSDIRKHIIDNSGSSNDVMIKRKIGYLKHSLDILGLNCYGFRSNHSILSQLDTTKLDDYFYQLSAKLCDQEGYRDIFRLSFTSLDSSVLDRLIKIRDVARKNKDFRLADQIRDFFAEQNVVVEDTKSGMKVYLSYPMRTKTK